MEDVSLNTLIVSLLAEGIGAMEELPLVERKARRPKRSGSGEPQPVEVSRDEASQNPGVPGGCAVTGV